ncbi:MAG: DNA repair protein RadC [Rickettsiaceae bacterium]|nr:DNA repair protein RadC [Rickettsiaceae bacterium]
MKKSKNKKEQALEKNGFSEGFCGLANIGDDYGIFPILNDGEFFDAQKPASKEREEESHFFGHRERLKERFLNSNTSGFLDYELLELVLFCSIPRKDVKPLAKNLLQEFGSLNGVINASKERLMSIKGITKSTYINFLVIHELISRMLQFNIMKKNVLSSWSALLDYLRVTMGNSKTEKFRILFLNKKNLLIADELQTIGTIDQTPVYPREVLKRALFHEASAIILVHNHPSGDASPSKIDVEITKAIADACKTVGINVHDHVIITSTEFYSFKSNLLI